MTNAVLIASTLLYRDNLEDLTPYLQHDNDAMAADDLVEFAARSVHRTWDNAQSNREYIRRLLSIGEESFFKHSSATFWLPSVSVGLANSLSTFDGLVVTQGSFTYMKYDEISWVPSPYLEGVQVGTDVADFFDDATGLYEDVRLAMLRFGYGHEEASRIARMVLPTCAETSVVVTGSLFAYRDLADAWTLPSADLECRRVILSMLVSLRVIAPAAFQDFPALLYSAVSGEQSSEAVPVA